MSIMVQWSVKKWITLIEVMISIYIFGVGVLVIMRMLLSNIFWLYDLKAKNTAVSLAKEGIDIVFHLRDSNIEKGMWWNCAAIADGWGSRSCSSDLLNTSLDRYVLNRSLTWLYALSGINDTGGALLRYHTGIIYSLSGQDYTWFWYNHDETSWTPSSYFRRIEIFPQATYPTHTWKVLWVRSIVQYNRWERTNQVILESVLWDMR